MFISAPDEHPSLLQAVVEEFVDGVLILTELGNLVQTNHRARQFCRQLSQDLSNPSSVPKEVWRVCWSLIDSREQLPQKVVLESKVNTPEGALLRIRAQWVESELSHQPYLLVLIEDWSESTQSATASVAKKYGFTPRQTKVWSLRQAGYSYKQIAQELFITMNTVKKHIKDIHAKILEVEEYEM